MWYVLTFGEYSGLRVEMVFKVNPGTPIDIDAILKQWLKDNKDLPAIERDQAFKDYLINTVKGTVLPFRVLDIGDDLNRF